MKKTCVLFMVCLLVVLLAGCHFYEMHDKLLAKKMTEKYSDDQNYVTMIGEIIEYDGGWVTIKCEGKSACEYLIYSDDPLELPIGEQVEFTTVPFHFYNGHRLPIVELKINGNTLLSFEEGKRNLLEWVNATFA